MKKMLFSLLAFGMAMLTACDSQENIQPGTNGETGKQEENVKEQEENIFTAEYTPRKDIVQTAEQQDINGELNEFAWKLFFKTFGGKEEPNLLQSPYSLTQILLMLSNGLQGETLAELKEVLDIDEYGAEELNQYILHFNKYMAGADSRTQYRTDNSLWYKNGVTVMPNFASNLEQYYATESFSATMNTQTRDSINEWTSECTYGRIPRLLEEGDISPQTIAVLVNTVYFRGLWEKELKSKDISDGTFLNEDGQQQVIRMVAYHQISTYTEGTAYQATSREFGNGAYCMDFILPREGATAADALKQYAEDTERNVQSKLVELSFPCFESATTIDMTELLKSLGVTRLFQSSSPNDFQLFDVPVFVSAIKQKTTIRVDEKGTEAAAGTYVIMDLSAGTPPETVVMTLDRPFFYCIRETSTNTPLFIGYQGSVD